MSEDRYLYIATLMGKGAYLFSEPFTGKQMAVEWLLDNCKGSRHYHGEVRKYAFHTEDRVLAVQCGKLVHTVVREESA